MGRYTNPASFTFLDNSDVNAPAVSAHVLPLYVFYWQV